MAGWIKLHRQMVDWEWYTCPNTMRVFIHCILKANHKPKNWRGIAIERGEFIGSYDSIAAELKLTVSKVRTATKKLILTGELTSKSSSQHTVFKVNNYESYNSLADESQTDDKRIANESQTDDKPISSTKKVKNEKNEKNEKKTDNKGSAKPPVDFSIFNMSDHQVSEVKRIRKQNKGGPISQRSANALAKEFLKAQALGLSTDDILTEWELRGWRAIKAEWLTNHQGASYEKGGHRGPALPPADNSTIGRAGSIADETSRDARKRSAELRAEIAAIGSQGQDGEYLEAPSSDQGCFIQQPIRND